MAASDSAYMEIDSPTAKEPVIETAFIEKRANVGQRSELLLGATSGIRVGKLHGSEDRGLACASVVSSLSSLTKLSRQ
jgi:hypothetical protein